MKRIFLQIQPFIYQQNITVFEDNQIIRITQAPITEIPDKLCLLAKEYNITEISVVGPSNYAKNIEKQTKQKEIEKYQNSILTFKYI